MTHLFRVSTGSARGSVGLVELGVDPWSSWAWITSLENWFLLLVEQKWRAVLFFCTLIFALSWIIFALLYYLILLIMNGKAVPDPTTACGVSGTPCGVNANGTVDEPHTRTCIANVDTLLDALLFSIETQHTIGYGYRYITTGCWPGYILWMIQLIVGYFLQTVLVCVIVAKVVRPKKRRAEIRFSKRAVIGELDSDDCRPTLMIRMADIQQDLNLTETHIKLYMATWKTNKNGCRVLIGLRDMDVGYDHGWDRVLLLWPITIRHIVDEKSPLYGLDEKSLQTNDFELILTLDSGVEATGMTFQARTSFVADEIDWGYNFSPMVRMNEKKNKWEIDYDLFDQVESCGQLEIASRSLPPENISHLPQRTYF
ncbi:unnamed protein product, partial [Mesorhabditis belari]|uniref:Uncharacterized protein n=1 Tax=Mesorhabditis belari TaxID=2138241 RepID=A0AAF3F378_9BILA